MPATLKSRIPAIIAGLEPRVNAAVRAGAEAIAVEATARAPDAPPQGEGLVEAIHVEDSEEAGGYYVVAGDEDVFWGHFVEMGTTHSAPHPFLIPAMESQKDAVANAVTLVLRTL